jgi:hypothetical protein
MLHTLKEMECCAIGTTDGVIGQIKDCYFDDDGWVIRYLVVQVGNWFSRRRVLISPTTLGDPNWSEKILPASISRDQIKRSPDVDTERPVSRQKEMGYLGYYGDPYYWGGGCLWGGAAFLGALPSPSPVLIEATAESRGQQAERMREQLKAQAEHRQREDPHLRSGRVISTYYVHAIDGDIGHVAGIIVDEQTWAIRYLVVNTSNWWLGHEVLVGPNWVTGFDSDTGKVSVGRTRMDVKGSPPYESTKLVDPTH